MSIGLAGAAVKNSGAVIAKQIGARACLALLEEVYTTPKPGLVDLISSGAHSDMDAATFEKSAEALFPYFVKMALLGYEMNILPEELFQKIRIVGMEAEQAMYCATDGVNTHKGILFTAGIFCAAAGRCIKEEGKIVEKKLFDIEQQMVASILIEECKEIRENKESRQKRLMSHGERNLKAYGSAGIRGEAIYGYPSVRNLALPVLRQGIARNKNWNLIKLQTLFCLMSEVEDSNIISRHNPEILFQVHTEAKEFLKQGGAYGKAAVEKLLIMDRDYIHRNISAGGCADLLAATIFIHLLCRPM